MTAGRLILMGSGELAPAMVKVHRHGLEAAGSEQAVILDSPYGFQENAPQLTERISRHFSRSLNVEPVVASYRHPGDGAGPRERLAAVVGSARYVFSGPGSPSYALARWREAQLASSLQRVLADGGTVTLASAAALTAGRWTIPVYEIYKVGVDPYWLEGLDLTAGFGFSLAAVPHWNNQEGGDHDTSHCYIGRRRFSVLEDEIDVGVLGIDEHTAVVLDFGRDLMTVAGVGGVTIQGTAIQRLEDGDEISIATVASLVGEVPTRPAPPRPDTTSIADAIEQRDADALLTALLDLPGPDHHHALRAGLVDAVEAARDGLVDRRQLIAGYVDMLMELRDEARTAGDFDKSDRIRQRLVELGIEVHDSPAGATWDLRDD